MRVFVTKAKTSAGHYRYEYVAEAPAAGTIWVESHYQDPDEGIRKSLGVNFTEVIIVEEGFPGMIVTLRNMDMRFVRDDGGRAAAGFKGNAGDCVPRAIAIATGRPYSQVYIDLTECTEEFIAGSRRRVAKKIKARGHTTPRNGVFKDVYRPYLERLGWEFVPTMGFGTGCRVHMRANELPKGRIIVRLSRHLAAVVDGVLHDTYDCSRLGTRCVYGYYRKKGT